MACSTLSESSRDESQTTPKLDDRDLALPAAL
jgi:hypothetical protein